MPPTPPLKELAADDGWEQRVARADPARAAALLADADALTSGSSEERAVALQAYGALQAAIDPADPDGCDRTEWVLNALREIDLSYEPLLRRAAETAERDVVRRRAGVALGAFRLHAGDSAGAESWFLRVLDEARGRGAIPERAACLNLCRLYVQQRRVFEAYVMARHAARLFRAAKDPLRELSALVEVLGALYEMRAWDAYDEASAELDALLPTLPAAFAERSIPVVQEGRVRALRARGRPEAALDLLDAHPPRGPDEPFPIRNDGWHAGMRAAILADLGRHAEAQELFAKALADLPDGKNARIVALQRQAICALRGGDDELALANARGLLGRGREELVARGGTGSTLRLLVELATALREHGHEDLAWDAFDQAAVVAVERIHEARRAVRNLPELGFVTEQDRALLARARTRFAAEHEDLLKSLALLLERRQRSGEACLDAFRDGDWTLVCAWCAQVRDADGTWLPVGHYLPPEGPLRLTHGVCSDCADRMRGDMTAPD